MNHKSLQPREDWSTILLAWGMVFISAYALFQADLTTGMEILLIITTLAFGAGFALSRSSFSGRTAFIYALVYGLFTIGYLLGTEYLPADMPWAERIGELIGQQRDWVQKAVGGGTNRNSTVFAAHTSAIFWALGYSAAWYTFRNPRLWRVVLPSGILLLSVVYFYYGPKPLATYLIVYLLLAMLYISRTHLAEQEVGWRQAAVRYERATTFNFLRGGFLLAAFVLLGAWTLPTLNASASVNEVFGSVNQPWRRFQDNWTRLYSSLRSYGGGVNDPYADSLSLGGPRNVSDSLIMDVYVDRQLPFAYWQSTVFQTYEDGQWRAPSVEERIIHIPDDGPLDVPVNLGREEVRQTVLNFLPNSGILYGLPEVVQSSRQMFVTRGLDPQGKNLVDLIQSRYILQQGDQYDVVSRMSVADETSLREAGTLYPAWTAAYLQMPDSITAETIALAADLSAPYDAPYDKAIAIQNYLRANITYNDQIEAPPNEVEPIHHILFTTKEGYCNYYASAMAIMLRSQGIPARVVAGYASGQFVEDANVYRVRASDAHTWVEAYFPRYGWVQFEPTSAINVIGRPSGEDGDTEFALNQSDEDNPLNAPDQLLPQLDDDFLAANELPEDDSPASFAPDTTTSWLAQFDPLTLWRVGAGVLVLVLSAVALYLANILNVRVETDVVQSYDRLGKWSLWLGQAPHPSQTPYERADQLMSAVPDGRTPIQNLIHLFVRQSYSPPTAAEPANPQAEWQTLRPLLIRHTLHHYWAKIKNFRPTRRNSK